MSYTYAPGDTVMFINHATNSVSHGVVRELSDPGYIRLDFVRHSAGEWEPALGSVPLCEVKPACDPEIRASYTAWRLTQ